MSEFVKDIPFLSAAESLPDAFLIVASDAYIVGGNRAARVLLAPETMVVAGNSLSQFVLDADSTLLDYLREGSRTRQPLPGALTLMDKNGCACRLRAMVHVLVPATDDAPAQLLLQIRDADNTSTKFKELNEKIAHITALLHRQQVAEAERILLEKQLLQAQKLESLGVLAGGIAHDFNNLLTSVIGYSELARTDLPATSSANKFIDSAITGARRAAELTQQMLAYSGKGAIVVQPVDLSSLVTDISRLLEVSISKKCVMRFELSQQLPTCMADATQLRQVIMNLIINASDAIGERSGVISVATGVAWCDQQYLADNFIDDRLAEGMYVHLEVADTGCGMSAETRARIFDPFFTTKFTGRGLGLAAVLGIVRGHKGTIRVYSELDRGTTFKVVLPATPELKATPAAPAQEPAPWHGSGTVLVVDDEESIRALARHMLTHMGFEVVTASDGREAVEIFRDMSAINPLVLLDLTMPHLDGAATFALLRRIRPDVRVILMSGYGVQTVDTQFAGKGLAGFLQKPFRLSQLRELVQSVVEP